MNSYIKLTQRILIVHELEQRYQTTELFRGSKNIWDDFLQNYGSEEKQIISFSKSLWTKMKNFNKKYFCQSNEYRKCYIYTYVRLSYQNTFHCVNCTRVLVVSCPVKWDFSFDIRDSNIWIMFYEEFHMLWVVVVRTPVQCSLLECNSHKFYKHDKKWI